MKRFILSLIVAVCAFTACEEKSDFTPADKSVVLSANIDQQMQTKTAIGNDKKLVWLGGDNIVAFLKSSEQYQFEVDAQYAGKSFANFSALSSDASMGSDWDHIVAYYPYSSSVKCTRSGNDYTLDVVIPQEQNYTAANLSNNTFPMVAANSNTSLAFKNVCGAIKLKFKGSAKVVSVNIKGNNNEKLGGTATVTAKSNGDDPSIAMAASASNSVTLNCASSVQLSQSTATEFIITLPPVTFTNGFTVTVTDTDSRTYTVETSKSNSVVRSGMLVMPEVTLVRDPKVEDNLSGWTNVTANYGTLPEYIKIYKSPSTLQGRSAVAYIAVADLKKGATWDVFSVRTGKTDDGYIDYATSESFVQPSYIYNSYWGYPPVIINGGYFYYSGSTGYSASLAKREWGDPLSYNINYEYNGSTLCYPTRAAFLENTDGTIDACWTYVTYIFEHYMYPTPAPAYNKNTPSASYPAGAKVFAAKTGIGGGPVLLNNGEVVNTWSEEMLSGISPTTTQPRTAIGATPNGQIVFFVAEGRGMTSGVYGFTTGEVANILKNLGCTEAINLDGGGSSCMLVNGKETIQPSDSYQRSIASAVMLK
ncbi:MAG: phosphodiester glycosidase family protein [Bacteroidales bacterium]|nr:phosphodiester glycosidase family protein [Bacteroidales bacterium]